MLYNDRLDPKTATAEQIVGSFNLEYYDKEIEKTKERIFNVRTGRPEFSGIYSYNSGNVYSGKDAERKIRDLEKHISEIKDQKKKYGQFISLSYSTERELDRIAERDALLSEFNKAVDKVSRIANRGKNPNENDDLVKHNSKKVMKASRKDHKPLTSRKAKITKKMYRALKKYSKKIKLSNGATISSFIEKSIFSLESLYNNLYYEKTKEYKHEKYGVDKELLEYSEKIMTSDIHSISNHYCTGDAYSNYFELSNLVENVYSASLRVKANKLIGKYEEILNRGKELKALEYVIDAFRDTSIKDSESYKTISELCRKESIEIREMVRDTDKEFESHKFEELIQTHKRLEELYRNYVNALEKHRNSDQADYSWSPFISEANEYRVEMYVLVAKYPELNRYEYKIDLEKQKELASKKADISHVPTSSEYVEKVQRKREVEESERIVSTANEVVEHPGVKLVAPVKLEIPSKLTIEETIDYTDDDELRKPIEIPDYLSGNVTYYYQNYMKEKLLKTELGNLKFSEYLEVVRPDLKELIEIERKREQRLDNIYKKYLKYRMALEDKTRVLSFREFAQYNYGLESYEIPEEYESSKKL